MGEEVQVHPRVMERHPEITEEDVITAWNNFAFRQRRDDGHEEYYAAIGFDKTAREIEMVALQLIDGSWFVYHALTPPTKKTRLELGLKER